MRRGGYFSCYIFQTLEATTLHMAAGGGHAKIVKILLENGANPEDENAVRTLTLCYQILKSIDFP